MNAEEKEAASPGEETLRFLSHELKAPLNAIQSLLNTVTEGLAGGIPPRAQQLLSRASVRADEAAAIISDVLDFQAYGGHGDLRRSEVDLTRIVGSLAARYAVAAGEKDIALRVDRAPAGRVFVLGDGRALEHAIRNIIENAVKYSRSGGQVGITVDLREDGRACDVRVTDSGPGVAAEDREKIFEPFYRSPRLKSGFAGTGLGLAIARRVAKAHGGQVGVEGRPEGGGSTFTLTLPVLRVEPGAEHVLGRKVVIIGGVTAGPKAASRLRRLDENVEIVIIEKSEFLSYTGCGLPHYISGRVSSPRSLMSNADDSVRNVSFFEAIKNIRVMNATLAERIDRKAKIVCCRDLRSGRRLEVPYDTLVLATGATPNVPPIPGLQQSGVRTLYNLEDAEAIRRALLETRAQDVAVIGGGYIGVSLAESLIDAGSRATILERRPTILADYLDADFAGAVEFALRSRGVKVVANAVISEVRREGARLSVLTDSSSYAADLVILATGVRPNSSLARECGLEIGPSQGIRVDSRLRTSDESIYAIGDCAESNDLITGRHEHWPLGSVSTKMGRIAADNIGGRPSEFPGSIGTSILRVFDLNVARTGLTLAVARERGFDAESIVVTGLDRAHYSPNAEYVFLKVVADRGSRVLLGAQGFGRGDIVCRMAILACAITRRMTLEEVFKLDLGYHPAFNRTVDVAQAACLALENKIEGRLATVSAAELAAQAGKVRVVDVSPASIHSDHSMPGCINVPMETLRAEEPPLDRTEPAVLFSNTSAEAYEAYRYLVSRGYERLRVLEGGYRFWRSLGSSTA